MLTEYLAPARGAAPLIARRIGPSARLETRLAILLLTAIIATISCCIPGRADDVLLTGSSSAAASLTPPPALVPSFRIETELFEGTQSKPQSQHLLLFDAGVVYDLPLGAGSTLSVVDPVRSRVMLLHKVQRVRTSISTDALIQVSAQVRAAAIEQGAEKSLGLSARVLAGESPDSYTIEFGDTKYTATTQPALTQGVAAEYAAFTVWACRLNIARHVGSPPFARMALADFLAAENALPRQIKLDVRRGLKTRTYRSEHLYVGRLSDLDRQKIRDVGEMMSSFQEVEFAAFPID